MGQSPRELRWAIATHGWGIITAPIRALRWDEAMSIGQILEQGIRIREIRSLHAIIVAAAQPTVLWCAPEGTITRGESRCTQQTTPRDIRRLNWTG